MPARSRSRPAREPLAEGSWAAGLFAAGAWAPTRALGRAVLVVGACVLLGVVLGRLELVVFACPFAVGVAWGLRRRPEYEPAAALRPRAEAAAEGTQVRFALVVANPNPVRLDLVVVRFTHSRWLEVRHGDRPFATDLAGEQQTEVELTATALRWGLQHLGPAVAYAVACDGLLLSGRTTADGVDVRVHPQRPPFRAEEVMPRASVLVGVHRSRRPGEGGELAGVRRYGPGDRLRRVDWRVTLRTGELHVAQTLSDRDAEVVVLLDVLYEAGRSGGIRGLASVVDTTVRAAAAITEHYLRQGDRVALLEYSGHPRHLRAASGRQQLHTAEEWLLSTRATAGAGDPPAFGLDPHLVPSAALVVVLSPLLGPRSTEMIAMLSRAGRVVIVVDTLGDMARQPVVSTQWTAVAQRLWRLEREGLIETLREAGVPVATWAGPGTLDQMLHDMTRMAAAPRVVVR